MWILGLKGLKVLFVSFSDLILCLRVTRKKYVESLNTYFE